MSASPNELFHWDLITFQVEDALYRVPKQRFVSESTFFKGMFEIPQGNGIVEGRDDAHPIHLPEASGITKADFETLITALYLGYDLFKQFTKKDWMCCLRLSTMWEFKNLRQLSIERLANASSLIDKNAEIQATPAEKVALGIQYDVPVWIQAGVLELVMQDTTVYTEDEKALLGGVARSQVFDIREELRIHWEKKLESQTLSSCGLNHGPGHGHFKMLRSSIAGEVHGVLRCSYQPCARFVSVKDNDETHNLVRQLVEREFGGKVKTGES